MVSLEAHLASLPKTQEKSEHFSDNEKLLRQLLSVHPPCSTELLRHEVLQVLSSMSERSPVRLDSLEVVGKSYEDSYLRPPLRGERQCVRGNNCMCNFLAKVRYGADTDMAFVGAEFLRPSEAQTWKRSGSFPLTQGRCVLCIRYVVTFLYTMARCNPRFEMNQQSESMDETSIQQDGSLVGGTSIQSIQDDSPAAVVEKPTRSRRRQKTCTVSLVSVDAGEGCDDASKFFASSVPMFVNSVNVEDGYHQSKLLFFEEEFMNTTLMRNSPIGNIAFRPFVRFCSTDYEYKRDDDGRPRIVQCGMSCWKYLNCSAPSDLVRPGAPLTTM